jgi:hypothetical protein
VSRAGERAALWMVGRVGGVKAIASFDIKDGRLAFINEEWVGKWDHTRYELAEHDGKLTGTARRESGETLTVTGIPAPALRREAAAWGSPIALLSGQDLAAWSVLSATKPGNWSLAGGTLPERQQRRQPTHPGRISGLPARPRIQLPRGLEQRHVPARPLRNSARRGSRQR